VTIVPDHHGRGTNVLGLHRDVDFTFEYGEDSALRHREQAQQRGVGIDWRVNTTWSFDIDTLEDLHRTHKEGGLSTPLP
jgi:2-phospho-L-lactate guanylyltransferase (CobY/MobA/RfbA family)